MEDYYDLDAILAEDEVCLSQVKVVICEEVHDLRWLTGGKSGILSRWMCRRGFDDPKIFNSRIRKALRADENHMELPLLSPHFY
ncbi:hypothetical protein BGZ52_001887, partial [Haplosporangium bisporale]